MSRIQEGKMGQTWFQNRPIEIEIVRSNRFRDPIAPDDWSSKISAPCFCYIFLAITCDY